MNIVPIQIPLPAPAAYDVRIAAGLLGQLGPLVHAVCSAPTCGIVSDSNVAPRYLPAAIASLRSAGYRVVEYIFPAGEEHKTIHTAVGGLDRFLTAKVERATPIIALGGGVVGDMAGFIAATLLRGTPFVQVPTTLLSAVDASVGGKVGVDHPAGKNLIGAFHQPALVLTDVATFQTLPQREVRCGLAECIKHAVIKDAALFAFLAQNMGKLAMCDDAMMAQLVAWNVRIKAAVVMADPFERDKTGGRALLNYGHTFGHALEKTAAYTGLRHGEAVALGMIAAARTAAWTNRLDQKCVQEIVDLIDLSGLATSLPDVDPQQVFAAMATDKKVAAGKLRLVLPRRLGEAEIATDVPEEVLRRAICSLELPAACHASS